MMPQARWESITAVVVIEDHVPEVAVFEALGEALASMARDCEIVVIANGVSALATQQLRAAAERVPDLTIHFLAQAADRDTATLLGIDQALGDWVVLLNPSIEDIAQLPRILMKAGPFEVVFAGTREANKIPRYYRNLARGYFRLYEVASRTSIDWPTPRIRVYSRAAARYLANHLDGEFLLRSLTLNGAFPGTREGAEGLSDANLKVPTLQASLRKAGRGLLGASAVPLRLTVAIALTTGMLALLNSLYAVIIYLIKPDVAPGWTTLTLQISTMMFLFSAMFALLAEYVLSMYRSTPPRRRISIIREIRSPLRRQGKRLNVVGADGQFQLGAPGSADVSGPPKDSGGA